MQHRPRLFVFDEPTSGLDPLMQTEFFKLIQEYVKEGATQSDQISRLFLYVFISCLKIVNIANLLFLC